MKFRDKWSGSRKKELTEAEMVEDYIDSRPDYHDGQIEALARKVEGIEKILAFLSKHGLTPEAKRSLAKELGYEVIEEEPFVHVPDVITADGRVIDFKTAPLARGNAIHQRAMMESQARRYRMAGFEPMPEAKCEHDYHLKSFITDDVVEACSKCGHVKGELE